jgi:hypothetical protein
MAPTAPHTRHTTSGLLIAGALALAIGASVLGGDRAWAQLPTTTLPPLPTSTTTTTAAPTTTTSSTTSTTSSTTSTTSSSTTTTSTTAPDGTTTTTVLGGDEESSNNLLGGGSLSITVPGAADLASGASIAAGSFSAQLGAVTVTDERGGVVSGWSAGVSATDFVTGGGSASERIPPSSISYWSGPATGTSGSGTFLPGQVDAGSAAPLSLGPTAFSALTASGNTSATWNPTVVVTIPPGVVIGQYTGTITHSVA